MEDDETDEELEDEEEGEFDDEREFVSDLSGDEDDGLSDLEDIGGDDDSDEASEAGALGKRKAPAQSNSDPRSKKRRGPRVEVEYEDGESVPLTREALAQW